MGRTELGEERIRGLRWPCPQEAINRSCPVCFVATDRILSVRLVTIRMIKQPSAPVWGAAAVETCRRGKRQKTILGQMFPAENHTGWKWQPGQREGLKPTCKAKA